MAYIDSDYYLNTFKGEPVEDPPLDTYINRASDMIDILTNFLIPCVGFDNLTPFQQDQIKKATAYQVEFYVLNGGDASINAGETDDLDNVRVGSFSYAKGNKTDGNRDINRVSPQTLSMLFPTGLLYQGIGTIDRTGLCNRWC